jgi:hypothetical protein
VTGVVNFEIYDGDEFLLLLSLLDDAYVETYEKLRFQDYT